MNSWIVHFHPLFEEEFDTLEGAVQEELLAKAGLLEAFGPSLARPNADTLKNSKYPNMKELRFKALDGVWRVAYAFDPERSAILLVAGDKTGVSETLFYKTLIHTADERFGEHLVHQKQLKGDKK